MAIYKSEHATEPIILQLRGGQEVELFLSLRSLRKVTSARAARASQRPADEAAESEGMEYMLDILWESVIDPEKMTRDQFERMIPGDVGMLQRIVAELSGTDISAPTQAGQVTQ